ncbi:transglutaminase family protein [Nocardioides oleivorans]|uniref:Transglutaminase family protein n=1 Tax=Nocardioides oleivorans TaxID=273676 RepID=A0A4Q2S4L4_9ACTN|nr:transglutaminase family protein [Nocardioides oleivorans]RYB95434.1 transglutaminase family protein [Nocardioides oleivorans]
MTIRVALEHRTTYTFAEPVTVHPHTVRLRPAPHSRTPIEAYSLTVEPRGHFLNWQQDPFGNYLARLVFPEPVKELDITVDLVADMTVVNPFDFFVEEHAERFPFAYQPGLAAELAPYLQPVDEDGATGPGPVVQRWLADSGLAARTDGIVDFLVAVNQAVQRDVSYTVRMEHGVQTPDHTLISQWGSCRDSAWLLVSVLRQLGLAARFVSGYLVQLTSDVAAIDGPSGPTEDFTDLHAWAEVFVPGAGWIGLDPTSGLFAGEGHIPLCATPAPASAAPISGATAPVGVSFAFHNSVSRIHEDARVTLPYSESQWAEVDRLGEHVDGLLHDGDVRLTMGGEPTFVSATDQASEQWSVAADGPDKRVLAKRLTERLVERWAPGGLVHHGQGKWYPGEPLPRWQAQLWWRADGEPLWQDPALLDHPWGDAVVRAGEAPTEAVARSLAAGLGVPDAHVLAAYDDPFARAWDEARRPVGDPVDPEVPEVASVDVTAGSPRAWVVPVFQDPSGDGWGTARWRLRRDRLFLTTGDSPAGYRLPLDSLAWDPPPDLPDRSPFAPSPAGGVVEARAATVHDVEESPRHAVVVEERDGHLFVFLPPLTDVDLALALVRTIEASAAAAGVPVVLEGYALPGDASLTSLSVTPDPGVIEVNIQPTRTWGELRDLTESLYEDARQVGLATEKFDADGTHTGTGGGNHFTLGGPTSADSPLLRRPDLLRSLITYWQHHPSLSYVFSGRFIGPTSQAPRVDEGRHETLYELEIAFAELERTTREGEEAAPWLVDRLFRHLLTDVTGNTHRSEFCIDKLYSPDSDRGRLGLLELRGFEMPPHPRMALVQAALVRALVARFWAEPYTGPLVRWGTRLHDTFLLPAFAMADLEDVVRETNDHLGEGAPHFDPAWLEPFWEFRFPRLGETTVAGVGLELRGAVEPWHVLGEEVSLGGTSRYVDSSVERVQVAATGLNEGRHVLTCNGVPVPMRSLDGRTVGGVRYRAWAPYSSLHPTIGIHSPLTFDLVDTWNSRSLGGFTYHVVHPGGRSYEDHPVNAMAAEARRASRFEALGHTSGRMEVGPLPEQGVEYPATLDLRRHLPGDR